MNLEKRMQRDPVGTIKHITKSIPLDETTIGINATHWIVASEWVGNYRTLVNMRNLLIRAGDDEEKLYQEHRKYAESTIQFDYIGTIDDYHTAYGITGTSEETFPKAEEVNPQGFGQFIPM